MAGDQYPFPEDEFDVLGRDRSPQAVHRAPRSWWRTWWPLLAVIVIAPLVAIGLVQLASNNGGSAEPPPATPEQSEPAATEEPPATGEETAVPPEEGESVPPVETEVPEETPAPVDQSVAVAVLNGARVQGLAGQVQATLQAEGWTSVSAGNYTSAQPETSAVFYASEDLLPAAQSVADSLGITTVTLLADGSVPSITVVLRPDFVG